MKIDAEKEGRTIARRYKVHGYPTILFMRADGKEVERIIGYLPPGDFLAEIKRINRGEDTYEALYLGSTKDQSNLDLALKLGHKLDRRGDYSDAVDIWERVRRLADPISEAATLSEFKILEAKARSTENPGFLQEYVDNTTASEHVATALRALVRLYRTKGNTASEAKSYMALVDQLAGTPETTSGLLNGYAWRMTQLDANLEDALEKIILGIEMADTDDPQNRAELLDTQAEILWKMGQNDQAIEIMDLCIELMPDTQYFMDQKIKFEASKTPA